MEKIPKWRDNEYRKDIEITKEDIGHLYGKFKFNRSYRDLIWTFKVNEMTEQEMI